LIFKFMEEDGLNNHIRITIGTRDQNCLLIDLIKTFLKKNNL
jgi:histidinol-phosphate/aromatic aminotransferase/cobyric acid decarboxylase-like protein